MGGRFPLYGKYPRKAGIIITGIPDHPVEDITFENVRVTFPGGGEISDTPVPEQENEYPEFPAFHPIPSWALFLRHVRGIVFRGCQFDTSTPDPRPPLHMEDVEGGQFVGVLNNGHVLDDAK